MDAQGLILTVRVTPRASRTEAKGVRAMPDGRVALEVRLAAPPVDGAANAALCAWVARQLDLARSSVAILSGETARLKRLRVNGDARLLGARLDELAR